MGAKYGQHFLTNQHAAQRIADALELSENDSLVEIGPGKGTLTAYFLAAPQMTIVEVDPEMVNLLRQRFASFRQIEVVQSDILEFDLRSLKLKDPKVLHKVVGNLPYNLTSPILRKLSEWTQWNFAVLMVQKEVADRLCAGPGSSDYGALTVGMNLTTTTERVFDLSPNSFNPRPKVDSTVIRVHRRENALTNNIEGTQKVIQAAFQQRRKTILNSLSHGLGMEKPEAEKLLSQCHIEPTIRPEKLPVQAFIDLADAWAVYRSC